MGVVDGRNDAFEELTSERTEDLSRGGEKIEFKVGGKGRDKRPIREFRGRAGEVRDPQGRSKMLGMFPKPSGLQRWCEVAIREC